MKFKQSIPYGILISPTPNNGFILKCGEWFDGAPELLEYIAENNINKEKT